MEDILLASTHGSKCQWTNRTDAIIQRVSVGLTERSKRLLALLCAHVKSTLPCDLWMVLNVCTVRMIDINKIK